MCERCQENEREDTSVLGELNRRLARIEQHLEDLKVTFQTDLEAAVDAEDQAVVDAANRVIQTINDNNTAAEAAAATIAADDATIAQLQAEVDAGQIDPATAQAVLDKIKAASDQLAQIDVTPVTPITVTQPDTSAPPVDTGSAPAVPLAAPSATQSFTTRDGAGNVIGIQPATGEAVTP